MYGPVKIKAISEWPQPVDGKALQWFLGAANFHRDFSHEYAKLAAPLEEIRNSSGKIEWTPERLNSFKNIKSLFVNDLKLRTIDWNKKIILTTDASLTGIGAWLGQYNKEGNIVPIVCVSKKMSPTQQRWSATKRELYALVWSMQKLRHYLLGRNFVARVDHRPLVEMLRNKVSPMMEGWIDTILQFDFTTTYLPGIENELADALSQSYEINNNELQLKQVNIKESNITEPTNNEDIELQLEAKRRGKIIPTPEERSKLIEQMHLLGHFSVETVAKKIWNSGHWWPQLHSDILNYVSGCIDCQRFNTIKEGYHPLKSIEANEPWDHIQIDLIGPLPESEEGFCWILTVVDVMTGFTLIRALHSKTQEEVAKALWQLICDFGSPKIIQSDNGTEFVNSVIHELINLYGIEHRLITAYNPRADGLVERKNKEIGRLLKKQMKGSTAQWQLMLPMVQLCLNLKELKRTGTEPFTLFFSRAFNGLENFSSTHPNENLIEAIEQHIQKINSLQNLFWPATVKRTEEIRNKKKSEFNTSKKIVESLNAGDKVMIKDVTRESKWDPIYEGPFEIVCQTKGGNYILKDVTGEELPRRIPIHQIKLIDGSPSRGRSGKTSNIKSNTKESKEETELGQKQHYEVLCILNHRKDHLNKGYEFFVRWKGYSSKYDSWVHESDFDGTSLIKKYWKQHRKGGIIISKNHPKKI